MPSTTNEFTLLLQLVSPSLFSVMHPLLVMTFPRQQRVGSMGDDISQTTVLGAGYGKMPKFRLDKQALEATTARQLKVGGTLSAW